MKTSVSTQFVNFPAQMYAILVLFAESVRDEMCQPC
jgi:hypothetical protein